MTVAATAQTRSGMVRLDVRQLVPEPSYCGIDRPADRPEQVALRITLDPSPDERPSDCPLTVDLYRTDGTIDAVAVYTAVTPDGP